MLEKIVKAISKIIYSEYIQKNQLDVRIYVENLFKLPRRPYFLIINIKHDPKENYPDLWTEIYHFDIIYVPQLVNQIEGYQIRTECQKIGDLLRKILDVVPLETEGTIVKGRDISYTIIENTLHFSITYALNTYRPKEYVYMDQLDYSCTLDTKQDSED